MVPKKKPKKEPVAPVTPVVKYPEGIAGLPADQFFYPGEKTLIVEEQRRQIADVARLNELVKIIQTRQDQVLSQLTELITLDKRLSALEAIHTQINLSTDKLNEQSIRNGERIAVLEAIEVKHALDKIDQKQEATTAAIDDMKSSIKDLESKTVLSQGRYLRIVSWGAQILWTIVGAYLVYKFGWS